MKKVIIIHSPNVDYNPLITWVNQFQPVQTQVLSYQIGQQIPKNDLIIVPSRWSFGPQKDMMIEEFFNNWFLPRILKSDSGINQPVIFFGKSAWSLYKHYGAKIQVATQSELSKTNAFTVDTGGIKYTMDQFAHIHYLFSGISSKIPAKLTNLVFTTNYSKRNLKRDNLIMDKCEEKSCIGVQLIGRQIYGLHMLPWKTINKGTSQNYLSCQKIIGDPISNSIMTDTLFPKKEKNPESLDSGHGLENSLV